MDKRNIIRIVLPAYLRVGGKLFQEQITTRDATMDLDPQLGCILITVGTETALVPIAQCKAIIVSDVGASLVCEANLAEPAPNKEPKSKKAA